MVPKAEEKDPVPTNFNNSGKDEACRCLLEDSNSRQFQKRSFLVRLAQNFGFVKSLFKSISSYSLSEDQGTQDLDKRETNGYKEDRDKNKRAKSLPNFTNHVSDEIDRPAGVAFTNNSVCTESAYGTFLNFSDLDPQDNLLIQIKDIVTNSPYCSRIAIGELIALKISRDIVELAEHEPCGLKGCKVTLFLEDCGNRTLLGDFLPKEGFICTFEVNVVLSLKRRLLRSLIPFFACMPQTRYVSDKYEISKEKLYTCSSSRGNTPIHWQK